MKKKNGTEEFEILRTLVKVTFTNSTKQIWYMLVIEEVETSSTICSDEFCSEEFCVRAKGVINPK